MFCNRKHDVEVGSRGHSMLLLEDDEDSQDEKERKAIWNRSWLQERNKGYFSQLLPDLAPLTQQALKNLCTCTLSTSKFQLTVHQKRHTRKRR